MKRVFLLIILFVTAVVYSNNVNVRLYAGTKLNSLVISLHSGTYIIKGDGNILSNIADKDVFQITVDKDSLIVKSLEEIIGKFKTVVFNAGGTLPGFKIKPVIPALSSRTYDNSLTLTADKENIVCINTTALENYVAGVVESESGRNRGAEYFKVQAILCRTYAVADKGSRHPGLPYEVCDLVHCQVYKNRSVDAAIVNATLNTKGIILVDNDVRPITAAFHSNCGGQTVNSEDVWLSSVPYLRSVKDSFCVTQAQAKWSRKIPKDDWLNYLSYKHSLNKDSLTLKNACNFKCYSREVYLPGRIPLKSIRNDWQLKSTYFNVEETDDSVVLTGRGFGHGVGLCQEGAMQMAKKGYSYKEILLHYYKGVQLVELSKLNFFVGD